MEGSLQLTRMISKTYYIYVLRNDSGNFYIGITSNLQKRIWEHKNKVVEGFTKKYNITKLVYYEEYSDPENAILREKQLKNWNRKKKIMLITKVNPSFEELNINP